MPEHFEIHGHKGTVQRKQGKDGSRQIVVWHEKVNGQWKTKSTTLARAKYEKKTGKTLGKDTDVDHKDSNKENNSDSNLQAMSHSKNVAKENKRRAK